MSYIVTMLTQSGIAMGADRQITQLPSGIEGEMGFYKIGTKTAKKLFTVGDNIAFSTGQTLHTTSFYPTRNVSRSILSKKYI